MIRFVIPGLPIPWKRPGINYKQKRSYDAQARSKQEVKTILATQFLELYPGAYFDVPVVNFYFLFNAPKGWDKSKRQHSEQEFRPHQQKPDVDNCVKFYLDCMVPMILTDDRICIIGRAEKLYSPHPTTIIEIAENLEEYSRPDFKKLAVKDSVYGRMVPRFATSVK